MMIAPQSRGLAMGDCLRINPCAPFSPVVDNQGTLASKALSKLPDQPHTAISLSPHLADQLNSPVRIGFDGEYLVYIVENSRGLFAAHEYTVTSVVSGQPGAG